MKFDQENNFEKIMRKDRSGLMPSFKFRVLVSGNNFEGFFKKTGKLAKKIQNYFSSKRYTS